jgi:hypothetical protein
VGLEPGSVVVADGGGAGIRGVVGPGDLLDAEHRATHPEHLALGRPTVAGDGFLDLVRGVLGDRDPGRGQGAEDDAPCLADPHGGLPIGREEEPLHRRDIGMERPG